MEKKKITRKDLKIQKGKIEIEYIEINGKKINLTPSNHGAIENYITHENCAVCESEFEKRFTYDKTCQKCQSEKEKIKYEKLILVDWDSKCALFDFETDDKYFFDISEVIEYCDENEIDPKDLKLVTCTKSTFSPISIDYLTEECVHEDWEPSKEFEEKLKEFNSWLSRQDTHTWFPSNLRVNISDKLTLPDS